MTKACGTSSSSSSSNGSAFSVLGVNGSLVRALTRKGYRQPTPIQRKCIPPLLEQRDVVGMARTGSGKTVAFCIPLMQHLKEHSVRIGVRGIILSPSRELALQTHGVLVDLIKQSKSDLRAIALVGGDGLEDQFVQLATNPDVIVATPGRLMHICVETGLSLKSATFVVWDEADRLMEDGSMAAQMLEIMARVSDSRQLALFSATLPQALADFASVGLKDPLLVRLDSETKLSEDLVQWFISVKTPCKDALLIALLDRLGYVSSIATSNGSLNTKVDHSGATPLTVVFVATKHHAEYLQELLCGSFHLDSVQIHGNMDQTARKSALEQFRKGRKPILIVTDLAARGIDVPLLDYVINYDFPGTPKLFVHRVGRVARAGRPGTAFTFCTPNDYAHLIDLQLFLGTEAMSASSSGSDGETNGDRALMVRVPQSVLDAEQERIGVKSVENGGVLEGMARMLRNASKLYHRTRPAASPESHRRAASVLAMESAAGSTGNGGRSLALLPIHPLFASDESMDSSTETTNNAEADLLAQLRSYKPRDGGGAVAVLPMAKAMSRHTTSLSLSSNTIKEEDAAVVSSGLGKRRQFEKQQAQKTGYALSSKAAMGFAAAVKDAVMDLSSSANSRILDEGSVGHLSKRKAARLQHDRRTAKTIVTEHGTRVRSSFKSDIYEKWRAKTHMDIGRVGEMESVSESSRARSALAERDDKRRWRSHHRNGGFVTKGSNRNGGSVTKRTNRNAGSITKGSNRK